MVCFCAGKRPHSREACESPPLRGGPGPSDQDRYVSEVCSILVVAEIHVPVVWE